jgi:hypothetical protein
MKTYIKEVCNVEEDEDSSVGQLPLSVGINLNCIINICVHIYVDIDFRCAITARNFHGDHEQCNLLKATKLILIDVM